MDIQAFKVLAAAITSLSLGVVGMAAGKLFSTLIQSVARNPSVRDKVFMLSMLSFALIESLALFALLVIFLILYT